MFVKSQFSINKVILFKISNPDSVWIKITFILKFQILVRFFLANEIEEKFGPPACNEEDSKSDKILRNLKNLAPFSGERAKNDFFEAVQEIFIELIPYFPYDSKLEYLWRSAGGE